MVAFLVSCHILSTVDPEARLYDEKNRDGVWVIWKHLSLWLAVKHNAVVQEDAVILPQHGPFS